MPRVMSQRSKGFEKIELNNKPLPDSLHQIIRKLIVDLNLKPGERINIEELTSTLGVSRTPVREVLQRLKTEGFVRLIPNVGPVVAELSIKNIEDTYAIRFSLEILAAEQAMELATAKDILRLEEILKKSKSFTRKKDSKRISEYNIKFHQMIYERCNNEQLKAILDNIYTKIKRYMNILSHEDILTAYAYDHHDKLLSCFKNHDTARFQEILKEHLEFSKSNLIRVLSQKYPEYLK